MFGGFLSLLGQYIFPEVFFFGVTDIRANVVFVSSKFLCITMVDGIFFTLAYN